ncbi:MAG: 16S rRNA (adenine(1518)-N(6)/adenine(1519)-N(6))-dimethyltransferase RsmA [Patescibacteria group bacterium]
MFQKKSLGQNFLKSKKVLSDIVQAGKIQPGETVLEIGPGEGSLTEVLLSAGAKVVAVEKDRRLIPVLKQKFAKEIANGSLTLNEADILDFNPSSSLKASSYKLIANIPYYITGMILEKFLSGENPPTLMVLMVQKEVAERIMARDGKESILSMSVKVYGTPRYVGTVKAGNFVPAPNVDSAILAIENISKKFFADVSEEKFFAVMKAGFAHKRKQLLGNLKTNWPNITTETLIKIGLNPKIRAEDLTLENWLVLARN